MKRTVAMVRSDEDSQDDDEYEDGGHNNLGYEEADKDIEDTI